MADLRRPTLSELERAEAEALRAGDMPRALRARAARYARLLAAQRGELDEEQTPRLEVVQ